MISRVLNPCQGPPHRSRVNGAQHRGRRKEKLQPHIGFSTVTVPSLAANGAVNKHSRSHAPSSPGVPNAGFVAHRQRDLGKSPYRFPTAAVTMLQKLEFMARKFRGPAENEVPAGPRASPPAPGATSSRPLPRPILGVLGLADVTLQPPGRLPPASRLASTLALWISSIPSVKTFLPHKVAF